MEKFLAARRSSVKNKSVKVDEERSRNVLAFFGAATPLTAITARRIAEYRAARGVTTSKLRKVLSPATINRECQVLRGALNLAKEWEEIASVPTFKMEKERTRERYLTEDEIARLLEACTASRSRLLLPLVTVALHTGLRKAELFGLTWERVDFARGVIPLGKRTKSGKSRDVPINQAVYTVLAPFRSDAGGVDARGRVWRKDDGGPLKAKSIDTAFAFAVDRAKLLPNDDGEPVVFHSLRHTFASHYVMRGGRLEDLQVILGHASIRTTEIYRHLAPDHLKGATAILDGLGTPKPSEINAPATHEPSVTSVNVTPVV
jgi:integrase